MTRPAANPDQRHGAIDLAIELDGDPSALAQASSVIVTTTQTCDDYQRAYAGQRARLAAQRADGTPPAPSAVTFALSAERAGQLSPGGHTRLLLVLAAVLDGQAIPGPVLTTRAACEYLGEDDAPAADPGDAWEAVQVLERTGLLTIDTANAPPLVRMSTEVAARARAGMPGQALRRAAQAAAGALAEAWPEREHPRWLAGVFCCCAVALQETAGDHLRSPDACHRVLLRAGHGLAWTPPA